MSSSTTTRVILITGANRGIGLAILQSLAQHSDSSSSTFLLGCRDLTKGEAAISQLRSLGITSLICPVPLDVTSDISLRAAVEIIEKNYGQLDVLINNAGSAVVPSASDFSDYRHAFGDTYNTNVTSVAMSIQLFLPMLRKSANGIIVNVSSVRGSIFLSASGQMPPTISIPYSISKTALNALTVELSRYEKNKNVRFYLIGPGHCKTEFNGFRGARDPLEGANVIVELVNSEKGQYPSGGFFETKGDSRELLMIPW